MTDWRRVDVNEITINVLTWKGEDCKREGGRLLGIAV